MILVDSNVPMYLVGADHPHKVDAQRRLEQLIVDGESLVTDAEVLQEILHRYVSIQRPDAIQPAFDVLREIVDGVLPMDERDVLRAKEIVIGMSELSSRDAIHASIAERHNVGRIFSFDRGFDAHPGIERIY